MTRDQKIGVIIGMIISVPQPDKNPTIRLLLSRWGLSDSEVMDNEIRDELEQALAGEILELSASRKGN